MSLLLECLIIKKMGLLETIIIQRLRDKSFATDFNTGECFIKYGDACKVMGLHFHIPKRLQRGVINEFVSNNYLVFVNRNLIKIK